MNIAIDLDGVLYPWHRAVYQEVTYYHKEKRDYITFWKEYDDAHTKLWKENIQSIPILYEKYLIKDNDLETLRILDKKHTLYYITNRPESTYLTTKYWMIHNKIPQRINTFYVKGDKTPLLVMLRVDYFIDDNKKHINSADRYMNALLYKADYYTEEDLKGYTYISSLDELRTL